MVSDTLRSASWNAVELLADGLGAEASELSLGLAHVSFETVGRGLADGGPLLRSGVHRGGESR